MLFASPKMGGVVRCQTVLQHDLCSLLEVDHTVVSFRVFPEDVEYAWCGARVWLRPDFHVTGRASASMRVLPHVIVKICCEADISGEWSKARQRVVESVLSPPGTVLQLVTPGAIRRQPRLANVRLLLRFRSFMPDPAIGSLIERAAGQPDGARIGDIVPEVRWAEVLASVAGLVLRGAVWLDLNAPIGPNTRVFSCEEETSCFICA